LAAEAFEPTVSGVVVEIENELARVLVGDDEDEWFFPVATMPDGAKVGSDLLFTRQRDGRLAVLGFARTAGHTSGPTSIEDRLARPLSRFRTTEVRAADLRAAVEND
jgi:hypothetical protein